MSSKFSLVALLVVLIITAGLSIGLTWTPCYSSLCSEEFFPFETRVHIAINYSLLLTLGVFFYLASVSPAVQAFSKKPLCKRRLPLLSARITWGGIFISFWILLLVLVTTALWLEIKPWWNNHLQTLHNWPIASISTLATSIIGHHADIILGLVIIPVPRHSAVCEAFAFPSSTLLWAHKALAYLLLIAVAAHGLAYMSFIAAWEQNSAVGQSTISLLNPYVANAITARLGGYSLVNFPSGIILIALQIVITISALAWIRRRHYELFYYIHISLGALFMIFACLHASTNFYCLLPGLLLWTYDWAWRLFGGSSLIRAHSAIVEREENGWYRVKTFVGKKNTITCSEMEKTSTARQPLQTYYLNIPLASRLQCHAMSAISTGTSSEEVQFLFSECSSTAKKIEWTTKVSQVSEMESNQTIVHLEGPYATKIPAMYIASHIICVVGGTGITGALSISDWWLQNESFAKELTIVWIIRYAATIKLPEWERLQMIAKENSSLHLLTHITSKLGRPNVKETIKQSMSEFPIIDSKTWVYVSGPEGLLDNGEDACLDLQKELTGSGKIDCYAARWEV